MAMLYVSGNPDVIRDLRQRAEEGGACIDLYTERDFPLEDRSEITLSRKHAREIAHAHALWSYNHTRLYGIKTYELDHPEALETIAHMEELAYKAITEQYTIED